MAGSYKKVIALGLDYSEFQGGLKECTQEMKKLDSEHKALTETMKKTASGSEKLAEQNEYLNQKLELQKKKVEAAKDKLRELEGTQGASASAIRNATIALNNETAEMGRLQNEIIDTNIAQSNLKESATALVAVLTAVTAAAISCAEGVAQYADDLQTLSDQTGMSVEMLQAWDYASELIDTDFNTMTDAFKKLEVAMQKNPELFSELGVSIQDSSGHMRNAYDVYMDTIDALGQIQNATEQDQMAMSVFGKSAMELTGMINAGSDGLKAYAKEAAEAGLIMSSDAVESASQMSDAMYKVGESVEAAKNQLGTALAPVIIAICDAISQIPAPTLAAAMALAGVGAVVVTLVVTVASAVKAFKGIATAMELATVAANPNLLIILAIVAALALLAIAIKKIIEYYKEWKKAQEEVTKSAGNLTEALNPRSGATGGSGGRGHNASGTRNWRGGETWVGEAGPEIVDLPAGSRIYNANESRQISSGNTYNINMNCDLSKMKSVNDVVSAIKGLNNSVACGGTV